jgi:hypothetical protein
LSSRTQFHGSPGRGPYGMASSRTFLFICPCLYFFHGFPFPRGRGVVILRYYYDGPSSGIHSPISLPAVGWPIHSLPPSTILITTQSHPRSGLLAACGESDQMPGFASNDADREQAVAHLQALLPKFDIGSKSPGSGQKRPPPRPPLLTTSKRERNDGFKW